MRLQDAELSMIIWMLQGGKAQGVVADAFEMSERVISRALNRLRRSGSLRRQAWSFTCLDSTESRQIIDLACPQKSFHACSQSV